MRFVCQCMKVAVKYRHSHNAAAGFSAFNAETPLLFLACVLENCCQQTFEPLLVNKTWPVILLTPEMSGLLLFVVCFLP